MIYRRTLLAALVVLACAWSTIPIRTHASALTVTGAVQDTAPTQTTALERGYRTGYSDGYNAGYRDSADRANRDFANKDEYRRADRSFNQAWGPLEDYRDGYQQGFEAGYGAGYDRRPFDSTIPTNLGRRGTADSADVTGQTNKSQVNNPAVNNNRNNDPASVNAPSSVQTTPLFIPRDSVLLIQLESSLSTDATQRGDRFQARVLEPREFDGAIVEGRVTRVKRPGKVKGTAELQLAFESIRTVDNRSASIKGEVIEVVDMGNRDTAGTVDREGGVKGRDSTRDDISRVGAATGIGAVIGAIIGGGQGAAIGAAIGGSVGTAGVLTQRGKDVRLERGQRLRIRTATDARIE